MIRVSELFFFIGCLTPLLPLTFFIFTAGRRGLKWGLISSVITTSIITLIYSGVFK